MLRKKKFEVGVASAKIPKSEVASLKDTKREVASATLKTDEVAFGDCENTKGCLRHL